MKATLAGTVALLAGIQTTSASILDVVYSGTVGYAQDLTGLLGPTGYGVYVGQLRG
jgi:hypothetical protein